MHPPSLDELWSAAPPPPALFHPALTDGLPAPARRWLLSALEPGCPLYQSARVQMTGEIKLSGRWLPLTAEQVLRWDRGFVWRARVRMSGLPVTGFDALLDGEGAMRWKMLGIVPVMSADGADISRSAAGRMHAEACWMPTVFLGGDVRWEAIDDRSAAAVITAHGEPSRLQIEVDERGALCSIREQRWGEPLGGPPRYESFGGFCEQPRRYGPVTVASRYRVGWFMDEARFASLGEFFRCTLDAVEYR